MELARFLTIDPRLFDRNAPEHAGGRPRIFAMNRWLVLCFALPVVMMTIAFGCSSIWPFGDRSILSIDLYHMYAPLIAHLHDIIYEGAGGSWTWSIGGGINYFTLYLTNVGSPLNAIIALFPKSMLTDLVALGMVLKVGLSGLCMGWLLRYKWRSCDAWTVAFSAMYALCGWMINYYWNIMWSDLLYLLPLCLMGIELIIEEGRFGVYVAALVAAMLFKYYIAALMCVFLLLYFLVAVFSRFSLRREIRWIAKRCLLFGGMSLLAAGLAAVCLLPVAKALMATSVISDKMPAWQLFHSFIDVLKGTLPGVEANIRSGGLPHIYSGLLCVWLLPLWLTDKRAPRKWRLLSLLCLAAMIVVMNIKALDFIWHAMHTPNDLPFRYSFCISALMIVMAYPAARRISRKTLPWLLVWGGVLLAFLAVTEFMAETVNMHRMVAVPSLMVSLLIILWLGYGKLVISHRATQLIALLLVCVELTTSAAVCVAGTGRTDRSYYRGNIEKYSKAADAAHQLGGDGFYRVETAKYMTLNDPTLYGTRGLSHFSSMLSANLQDLMHKLGYQSFMLGTVRANRQAGQPNTPVADSMLGVRYLLTAPGDKLDELSPGLRRQVWTDGETVVLENPYALPLVYLAGKDVLERWTYSQNSPFSVQNDFIARTTGIVNVLRNVRESTITGEGVNFIRTSEHNYRFNSADVDDPGTATLTFRLTEEEYLYFYADGDQMTHVSVEVLGPTQEADAAPEADQTAAQATEEAQQASGGQEDLDAFGELLTLPTEAVRTESNDGRYPKVIEVGRVTPEQEVVVRIKLGRTRSEGTVRVWMCSLDMESFEAAMAQLSAAGLEDMEYSNSHVKGVVHAQAGQCLMTSIPADEGWTLYVDGQESDIVGVGGGAFIGARLTPGRHEIELRWTLPGFAPGLKVTLGSLLLLALLLLLTRLRPLLPSPRGAVYQPWDPVLESVPPPPKPAFDSLAGQDLSAFWLDPDDLDAFVSAIQAGSESPAADPEDTEVPWPQWLPEPEDIPDGEEDDNG